MVKTASLWISLAAHGLLGAACLTIVMATCPAFEEPTGAPVAFDVRPPDPVEKLPQLHSPEIATPPPAVESLLPQENVFRELEIRYPELPFASRVTVEPEPVELPKVTSDLKVATDSEPQVSRNSKPKYPILARRKGWEGRVVIQVEISDAGVPVGAKVVESSGYTILDDSALEAVKEWTFEPAFKAGRPHEGSTRITFEFRLDR